MGHAWAKLAKPANEFLPARRWVSANVNPSGQTPSSGGLLDGTLTTAVGPLMTTNWDQGSPHNLYTPGVSGSCTHTCPGGTATPVAHMMRFWSWPPTGTGSSSYSWNGETLSASYIHADDWADMPLALSDASAGTEIDAVARLMSDTGIADQMIYGCSGSGASPYLASLNVLPTYFRYQRISLATGRSSHAGDQFFDLIRAELDLPAPRVALLEAWSPDGTTGHALVVDGYQMGSTNQVHVNLGWSGYSDGYHDITNNWLCFSGTDQTLYRGVEPDDGVTRAPAQPVLLSPAGALTASQPTYS